MRSARLTAAVLLALTVAACDDDEEPTGPDLGNTTELSADERRAFASVFREVLEASADADPNGAQFAPLSTFGGVVIGLTNGRVSRVRATSADFVAQLAGPTGAQRRRAGPLFQTGTTGQWQALGLEVTFANSTRAPVRGVFLFQVTDDEDGFPARIAFGYSESGSGTIGVDADGVLGDFDGNDDTQKAYWVALTGSVSLTDPQSPAECATIPVRPTQFQRVECTLFSYLASLDIASSEPANANASGSPTVSLASQRILGARLTIDCDADASQLPFEC